MGVSENALLAWARGYLLKGAVLAALGLLMMLLYASTARAQTFTVTNLNDSGPGSLREAIEAAEVNAGADEIVFAEGVGGTITLASSLPVVRDPAGLIIDGGGDVTVSGNNAVQIFLLGSISGEQGAALSLRNLKITDGKCPDVFCAGAAIFNVGKSLEVTNTTISGNDAARGDGGGIANFGSGPLTVTNSTITDNSAVGGGGIYNRGTDLTVTNSTISGNSASVVGGGILDEIGMQVTNSTITDNSASDGGGIYSTFVGGGQVTNSTIAGNSASGSGGGIFIDEGNFLDLRNTIVANNTSGGNCFRQGGFIVDDGYNVENTDTCGFTRTSQQTGSLPNTDPLLDPAGLADNGGPTQTIALLPQSPAVDLVGQEACPPPQTDQRGVERPQGEACDSGAFELVQGPQTKADCKQGGYKEFGFNNQGQCIASLQRNAEATQ